MNELDDDAVNVRLLMMRDLYENGLDADPSFYRGINLVMFLRVARSRNAGAFNDTDAQLPNEAIRSPNSLSGSCERRTRTTSGLPPLKLKCFCTSRFCPKVLRHLVLPWRTPKQVCLLVPHTSHPRSTSSNFCAPWGTRMMSSTGVIHALSPGASLSRVAVSD